jgi:LPS sulfotransferase NodH/2-polyprenyl-3-methyl-5-hydroxy-6-metoxy-1,4-benzoquinol methylase
MVPARGGARLRPAADPSRPAENNPQTVTAKSFDLPGPMRLSRSYIVASTPRCGSTFLCSLLWQTGVLGAPSEYWNCHKSGARKTIGIRMMERLEATSGPDYLTKLLACRTSKNGVFGVKVHFFDFQEVLRGFPQVLELLAPVTFINIEREDKIAQAVSLARSLQTGTWIAGSNKPRPTVTYDRDLISRCLGSLETQKLGWTRWFDANRIDPYVVTYEKLAADTAGVVSGVVKLIGAQDDEPHAIQVRTVERQSDGTNKEWAVRFKSDVEAGSESPQGAETIERDRERARPPRHSSALEPALHFFERYDRIKFTEAEDRQGGLGVFAKKRRRDRYEAIVGRNRALFQNARVLDLQCGGGIWSLAALDAGAAHVVGVDSRKKPIETATETFTKYGVETASYQLVKGKMFAELRSFSPGAFDLILCQDSSADLHFLFDQFQRLRPKHVILDTAITRRKPPVVIFKTTTFKLRDQKATASTEKRRRRIASIVAIPSQPAIDMLCVRFGFACHLVDWHGLGLTNWVGVTDYENDRRRTYVLELLS